MTLQQLVYKAFPMMKKWIVLSLSCLAMVLVAPVFAQTTPTTQPTTTTTTTAVQPVMATPADSTDGRKRIAIFTPLYLDSAFDVAGNYRYDAKTFPRQSSAGLEFWEGAELAIDS